MESLHRYRKEIDEIDEKIIQLLADRIRVVEKIKEYKKENSILFFDEKRYSEVIVTRKEKGKEKGLKEGFVRDIFNVIHEECLNIQLD